MLPRLTSAVRFSYDGPMCYSAQIRREWKTFCSRLGVRIPLSEYVDLYWTRAHGQRVLLPKSLESLFDDPRDDEQRRGREALETYATQRAGEIERELFALRQRIAEADRKLAANPSKSAAESRRIAQDKTAQRLAWLADLRRTASEIKDARIYPGWHVPVIVREQGEKVLRPMRYQCRPAGKPASYDLKYPGTYNARRDALGGFWKGQFGVSHGVLAASSFFENVRREDGSNVVLEFSPQGLDEMLIACLWSRWEAPGEAPLLSFAVITDEPPPEIAAAGHDRCVIPLKPEHLDAWLDPQGDLAAMQAILDDRERPVYGWRMAA